MSSPPYTLSTLASALALEFEGNPQQPIGRACPLESPERDALSFCEKISTLKLEPDQLSVLLASSSPGPAWNVLLSPHPRVDFARALALLYPPPKLLAGVHPTACLEAGVIVDPSAWVGPFCSLASGVVIEAGCQLVAQVAVGANTRVGARTQIHPGVTVGPSCQIGEDCLLEPLSRLSQSTTLGHRVYVGARVVLHGCVVEEGCKIDNLAMVGKGARIGKHAILVSQCLVGSGAKLGDYTLVAAQAVVDEDVEVAARVQVAGRCWVNRDILTPGIALAGEPATDYAFEMRCRALRARLT